MTGRLKGKVAFITGGGSGIGAATACRFAEEKAIVIICGRRKELLDQVVAAICAKGGQAYAVQVDVSNEDQYVDAINDAARCHGRLDILVNNAMAYSAGPIEATSTAAWHVNFSTTLDGTFWGTRAAMQLMHQQGMGGSIVNVSSICGLSGAAYMAGYSAAKAAIINFSRAAAAEGGEHNIRCNVVIPGTVETPPMLEMLKSEALRSKTEKLIPMRRVGQPMEVANAILFLASDEASYVNGSTLTVDGGQSSTLLTSAAFD
ncbi:2,5-dichloro-2,5-cyclohexadiene-1,4-diol dehydrogenase [Steroidobacter denitrificans]|uniref:2,5-dichloro-2,5-cyclohexadiene-1,4-diol dehydrogenase n=1 Tax=Steroidobacter denitrificans TaxID=465721 RepID=A0A127F593_STEDE|nr:SDR family NAD(P)-dependent oxidoreductase [Steroidobacter denitrificans]AMN45603.1 2,5-dichloro-2,5-cyclohexadiene-1,4-diol dehydrogenase [Steroidobacter denitrificans]